MDKLEKGKWAPTTQAGLREKAHRREKTGSRGRGGKMKLFKIDISESRKGCETHL